jgi:hypothetical protein
MVGESPDPIGQYQEEAVGVSDVRNGRGLGTSGPTHNAGGNSLPTTTMPTSSTTYPDLDEGAANGVGNQEEVLSSPQEPFLGMQFDTIEVARAHYNAYAIKKGFSVKSHTSKRKARTNKLEKLQFVCNKFRKPKTEEQMQKERMTVLEDISPVQLDDEGDGEEVGTPSKILAGSLLGARGNPLYKPDAQQGCSSS